MVKTFISFFAAVLILLVYTSGFSYPGGISGRTLKSGTNGCSSCHTANSTTTGTITGPDTVLAGSTVTFTISYSGTNSGGYGVDIAAQIGTLGIGSSGSYIKLLSNELVHKNALSVTTFTFSYTAPNSIGWDTLYATVDKGYSGRWSFLPNKKFYVKNVSSIFTLNEVANEFKMFQNYPNPFNPVTKIEFSIPKANFVLLKVYNSEGKEIQTLINSSLNAGIYSVTFDGSALSSGVYYYRISAGEFIETKKMTIIK